MSLAVVDLETTLHVRDTCLCLHVQRAARAMARRFDDALRPTGLTNNQFSLLNALNGPQPKTPGALSALLGSDRTTLTAAIKLLARRGLASIAADRDDGRVRWIALTVEGHARLAAALPLWTQAHETFEAEIGDGRPARLRQDLNALTASRPIQTGVGRPPGITEGGSLP